jgi:hypothetical protein
MTTEQMLSVLAILRAYATCDAEGIETLIGAAPASAYADLLAFSLMTLQHQSGDVLAYLDRMANEVLTMHVRELAEQN